MTTQSLLSLFTLATLQATDLASHSQQKIPAGNVPAAAPERRYAAGALYSVGQTMTSVSVYRLGRPPLVEFPVQLPGASAVRVQAIATAADGRFAVSAGGADPSGRLSSAIIFYTPEGAVSKIVKTWPFTAARLAFTVNGVLWAAGVTKDLTSPRLDEAPGQSVLRQYSPEGTLVGSSLARESLSTDPLQHPLHGGMMAHSNHFVAILTASHKLVVVDEAGRTVSERKLELPEGHRFRTVAVTDSGRVFAHSVRSSVASLFEVDTRSGTLRPVSTGTALPDYQAVNLVGSEGESLVFFSPRDFVLTWAALR